MTENNVDLSQTVYLKQRFVDTDKNQLLMEQYKKGSLSKMGLFDQPDFFDKIQALETGETLDFFFPAKVTSTCFVREKESIPLLARPLGEDLVPGSVVTLKNTIARVKSISNAWAELEFFPAWLKGKNIRVETILLEKHPATPEEPEEPWITITLHPQ